MKALLIAPEPTVWTAVAEALGRRGHEVVAVEHADTASHLQADEPFPLVILDVDAFADHGLDLCRQWKASHQGPPQMLLALSRRDEPAFLEKILQAGADDYLNTLDDPERLALRLAVVERHILKCHDRLGMASSAAMVSRAPGVDKLAQRKKADQSVLQEQQTLHQMLEFQERDRQILAYELHDGFAQQLTGAAFYLQGFQETLPRRPDEAWRLFEMALRAIKEAGSEIRRLIRGLRPLVLDEAGLIKAVSDLVDETRREAGLEVEFVHNLCHDRLAEPLENTIFRVVQEGLTNVRRHSLTDRLLVKLLHANERVRLEIRDWGIGFNPAHVAKGHFGLEGIVQRARLLGGHASIDSRLGHGTCLVVDLPWVERMPE